MYFNKGQILLYVVMSAKVALEECVILNKVENRLCGPKYCEENCSLSFAWATFISEAN